MIKLYVSKYRMSLITALYLKLTQIPKLITCLIIPKLENVFVQLCFHHAITLKILFCVCAEI